ncbi:MAG: hypothetical protein V3U43_04545 [Pseudomonadales bacterium]
MRGRIAAIIEEYSGQGIHRTGTEGDRLSGAWLAREIRALGIAAVEEPIAFSRLEIDQAFVEVGDERFHGLPRFDCRPTGADGVIAPLSWVEPSARGIGVAVIRAHGGGSREALRALAREDHLTAGVAITDPEWMPTGMGLLNAPRYAEPTELPVLQLPAESLEPLRHHIDREANARLVIDTHRVESTAFNVGASIPGEMSGLAPVVVMTPRSGWWSCAQERGGGIAAFVEVMRAVAVTPRRRDVLFTANTGHELGHLGLDHFLQTRAGLTRNAHCWIHFGANFASRNEGSLVLQFSSEELQSRTLALLSRHGLTPDSVRGPGERPGGEATNIFDGGGQYISVLGHGHYFHHPDDVWPDTVDVDRTTRTVAAFCELVVDLANAPE